MLMHHQSDQLKCSFPTIHSIKTLLSAKVHPWCCNILKLEPICHKTILTRLQKEAPYWHIQLQVLETSILPYLTGQDCMIFRNNRSCFYDKTT